MRKRFLALGILFSSVLISSCHHSSRREASSADSIATLKRELADSVRQEFRYAWRAYTRYAWGHDMLKPISRSYADWYSRSLEMTPVDAFDTMLIMGLSAEADSAKKLILDSLRFDVDASVSVFETTIRLVGGLESAYEMDGDTGFLSLAKDLTGRLLRAYDTPTGIPRRFVNLKTGKASGDTTDAAQAATALLEMGTLSRLTGDSTYYHIAKRAVEAVYSRRSPVTGLVGNGIDVISGKWVSRESSISAGTDSYYEYLLKGWKLFGDHDCKRMWDSSVLAVNRHLADTAGGTLWYGHAQMDTGVVTRPIYGALDAFFAGTLALGGDTARAASLQDSNFRMWRLSGLEPEVMNYRTGEILNGYYALRPENLESCYYLYHYTGESKYLYMGAQMFRDLVRYCRTLGGYAAIKDVRNMVPDDVMESFFLAETLKYAYLLFAPAKTLNFAGVVFNTEGHPLKR